jgi:hypothetical protein
MPRGVSAVSAARSTLETPPARPAHTDEVIQKSDRAFNIDPPTSSYANMRRACPYRGENFLLQKTTARSGARASWVQRTCWPAASPLAGAGHCSGHGGGERALRGLTLFAPQS